MLRDEIRSGVRLFTGDCHDAIALMVCDRFHGRQRSRRKRLSTVFTRVFSRCRGIGRPCFRARHVGVGGQGGKLPQAERRQGRGHPLKQREILTAYRVTFTRRTHLLHPWTADGPRVTFNANSANAIGTSQQLACRRARRASHLLSNRDQRWGHAQRPVCHRSDFTKHRGTTG